MLPQSNHHDYFIITFKCYQAWNALFLQIYKISFQVLKADVVQPVLKNMQNSYVIKETQLHCLAFN